jgi:hypothetical protein
VLIDGEDETLGEPDWLPDTDNEPVSEYVMVLKALCVDDGVGGGARVNVFVTVTVCVTPVGKGVILELPVRTLVAVTDDVTVREPFDDTDVVTLAVTVFDEDDEPVIVEVLYIVIDCTGVFVIVERAVLVFEGAALLLDETEVDCVFD